MLAAAILLCAIPAMAQQIIQYTTTVNQNGSMNDDGLPAAAMPIILPVPGTYDSPQVVTISDPTPGATIYYTNDGVTTPTTASIQYTGAISASSSVTIQAIAVASGYSASAVAVASYEIIAPVPSYSMSATPLTVTAGTPGTSIVTVSSSTGYVGTVSLTCAVTAAPSGATDLPTCSGGQTVTLSADTTSGTATVQVNTKAGSNTAMVWPRPGKDNGWGSAAGGAVLALLVFFGYPARRRNWQSLLGLLVVMAGLGFLSSCSGGSSNTTGAGTTKGTYTITVSGTGNDDFRTRATTTFTLTVN